MAITAALLFLLSCALAVAAAPAKLAALDQAALLVGGLFVAWVLTLASHAFSRRSVLGLAGALCAALAAGLCAYTAILRLDPAALPWAAGDTINPNVLATGLVVLLPLGAGGLGWLLGWPDVGEAQRHDHRRFHRRHRQHRHSRHYALERHAETEAIQQHGREAAAGHGVVSAGPGSRGVYAAGPGTGESVDGHGSGAGSQASEVMGRSGRRGHTAPLIQLLQRSLALLTALALLAGLAGLALTRSRGGVLGLSVGLLAAGWIAVRRRVDQPARLALDMLVAAAPLSLAGLVAITLLRPDFNASLLGAGAVAGSSGSRAELWRAGWSLAGDYRFTGLGFGATMMALSTYVYLLHVGFVPHVHNFLLELAVEQGLIGLMGYGFLLVSAGWALVQSERRRTLPRWWIGLLAASLVGMLVHGLFDGGPYVSRLAPLCFLPLGFAWGAAPTPAPLRTLTLGQLVWRSAAVLAPPAALLLLLLWPGSRGALQANLGAVEQSSRELALYSWPAWDVQDRLRRSAAVDLDGAIARYAAALQEDPQNVTAHRRLGQIAVARGDLAAAQEHLTAAWQRAPQERATRLLLGEVLALQGQPEQAAALWRTVDTSNGSLDVLAYWLSQVGTAQQQQAFARARAAQQ